ncbi:MAG: hypothetical protein Q4D56_06545 [Bacteroides sp.]|nr:hypothetical protein [Bacteroides sp.]
MYNKIETNAIAKKRYCFRKGFLQVPIGKKQEFKAKLMAVIGITGQSYFSNILNKGIPNITMSCYEGITALFQQYGITDVWEIFSSQQES